MFKKKPTEELEQLSPDELGKIVLHMVKGEVISYNDGVKIFRNLWDIQYFKKLLYHGASLNSTDRAGFTPLQWAAYRDDRKLLKILIKAGADINIKDSSNISVLKGALNGEYGILTNFMIGTKCSMNIITIYKYVLLRVKAFILRFRDFIRVIREIEQL